MVLPVTFPITTGVKWYAYGGTPVEYVDTVCNVTVGIADGKWTLTFIYVATPGPGDPYFYGAYSPAYLVQVGALGGPYAGSLSGSTMGSTGGNSLTYDLSGNYSVSGSNVLHTVLSWSDQELVFDVTQTGLVSVNGTVINMPPTNMAATAPIQISATAALDESRFIPPDEGSWDIGEGDPGEGPGFGPDPDDPLDLGGPYITVDPGPTGPEITITPEPGGDPIVVPVPPGTPADALITIRRIGQYIYLSYSGKTFYMYKIPDARWDALKVSGVGLGWWTYEGVAATPPASWTTTTPPHFGEFVVVDSTVARRLSSKAPFRGAPQFVAPALVFDGDTVTAVDYVSDADRAKDKIVSTGRGLLHKIVRQADAYRIWQSGLGYALRTDRDPTGGEQA